MTIYNYLSLGNAWRDAFVEVPSAYDNYWISEIYVSFGDAWPSDPSNMRIEMRDINNSVVNVIDYTHPNQRFIKLVGNVNYGAMQVSGVHTLNVTCLDSEGVPAQDQNAAGYTVTLRLEFEEPTPQ